MHRLRGIASGLLFPKAVAASASTSVAAMPALSWKELAPLTSWSRDPVNGPTNAQARLRLFGRSQEEVRVTLFRDNHAWCPYCQKVWLYLEEMRVPYKIAKVTMFCYGEKEAWYTKKVRSGMLPAIELDGRIITDSDEVLAALEGQFGPLGAPMRSITPQRKMERLLFGAWCQWLCYPASSAAEEERNRQHFLQVLAQVDVMLQSTPGPFFLEQFSLADAIFTPYVERMNASLYYYKAFNMKEHAPALAQWFRAMEGRETYRGTQSDAHTHVHDLPPQMGGCYENGTPEQQRIKSLIDQGPSWDSLNDCDYSEPADAVQEALARTLKHHDLIVSANCVENKAIVDEALRCALTTLVSQTGQVCGVQDKTAATALYYIRDRINVPRDMSVHAARRLRRALTLTAAEAGPGIQGPPIPIKHRRDQDPRLFATNADAIAGA